MLLSGSREEMGEQLGQLLEGYTQFSTFDPVELVLVESLRSLRMIHYSAWLARRWSDPATRADRSDALDPSATERAHGVVVIDAVLTWRGNVAEINEETAASHRPLYLVEDKLAGQVSPR